MCGIVGVILEKKSDNDSTSLYLKRMLSQLWHRGPDSSGHWSESNIYLGHTRLAVVDLTSDGYQPMISQDGRWVIVYNGEIYNTTKLKSKYSLNNLNGTSDTEVLLEIIARHGILTALEQADGMFSFAVYDRHENKTWLARDKFGEKPLFIARTRDSLIFSSELKSINSHPDFDRDLDHQSIVEYLSHRMIPSPHTIYKNARKLFPGELLCINQRLDIKSIIYWDAVTVAKKAKSYQKVSDSEILNEFESILESSVASRMIADVPVGVFLSGGIDSSLITGIMQKVAGKKNIHSFSIEFEGSDFDESFYSKTIAEQLGTSHTPYVFTAKDALNILPDISEIYDEPLSNESLLPLVKLSDLARSKVTVSLSGEGADELFCGYPRYLAFDEQVRRAHSFCKFYKPILHKSHDFFSLPFFNFVHSNFTSKHFPKARYYLGEQSKYRADSYRSTPLAYRTMRSSAAVVNPYTILNKNLPIFPRINEHKHLETFSALEQAMLIDTSVYLPDVLLARLDRASMASSLECRAPFLNPDIYAFAWSIGQDSRVRNRKMKWPLRQLLANYIPQSLIDRPKMGLGWPINEWLRGPLKNWANDLLDPTVIKRQEIFDPNAISKLWSLHLKRHANYGQKLWTILILQSWLNKWHKP